MTIVSTLTEQTQKHTVNLYFWTLTQKYKFTAPQNSNYASILAIWLVTHSDKGVIDT